MSDEKLRESLERLKQHLHELDESDEVSRRKLAGVIDDVQRRLNEDEEAGADKSLRQQLKDAVIHFEVQHPTITKILNDISITLSNMGL